MSLVEIRTADTSLTIGQNTTVTTADLAAASGTLTVKNITGFAVNQILLIGFLGNQGAEIVKTSATVAPTGSTITLATNTVFPHSSSTAITLLPYDQVEISSSTTIGGTKTVLTTMNLFADSEYTSYNDSTSSVFYYSRFKNSITSAFSTYSDPIPATSYSLLMARSVINSALAMLNKDTSEVLSDEYAFAEIDNCQMEVLRELKRWSFMQQFNYDIGEVTTGQGKIALPSDCDDQNSTKSIYNFKIGTGVNVRWVDKAAWNDIIYGVSQTTLKVSILVGVTSITLTDSSDFSDSGTIQIGANTYTYSANDRATGILTCTLTTTTNTALEDVYQGAAIGVPSVWTTYGGYIYFYPLVGATLNQRNAYLDYYVAPQQTITDTSTLMIPDPTVAQYFLAWKFLLKLANGKSTNESEVMYGKYVTRRAKMIQKESINRTFQLRPQTRSGNRRGDSKMDRLSGFTNF